MHEVAHVNAAAHALLHACDDGPVARATVGIGPRVEPEIALQTWQVAVAGTGAENAEVSWVPVADTLRCFGCGNDYDGTELTPCPECGGTGLVIRQAPEVELLDWAPVTA